MTHRPLVLSIDLDRFDNSGEWHAFGAAEGGVEPVAKRPVWRWYWSSADPALQRVGEAGGSALAACLVDASLLGASLLGAGLADGAGPAAPFVLAVGDAVRRGVPTAARACVGSRSPLTGRYSEGQVGSDLALHLLCIADALALVGRTDVPGAVLVLDSERGARVDSFPELVGRPSSEVPALLRARLGAGTSLRIGPAGEALIPFASLAAGDDEESFVGRGGLGAVLGERGLKALYLVAASGGAPAHPRAALDSQTDAEAGSSASGAAPGSGALVRALLSSPRLQERSRSGSFELLHAAAARGDLRGADAPIEARLGARMAAEADERPHERRGCRGCPTPCGWVFRDAVPSAEVDDGGSEPGVRAAGTQRKATFSAVRALGPELGFDGLEPGLTLLADCDAAGLDAVEVGAVLRLWAQTRGAADPEGPGWGDLALQRRRLEELVGRRGAGRHLALGAVELGRSLGLAPGLVSAARGQSLSPESNLAALLGQCVASGGADPMRSFPFAVEGGGAAAVQRLRRLVRPLPLPDLAADPHSPAGKGRLVFWHENLVAGLDATGFCAFSAAALLADELADLDGLAEYLLPAAWRTAGRVPGPGGSVGTGVAEGPGAGLLALGAAVVVLRHRIDRRFGAERDAAGPEWAREVLAQPGMLAEYRNARGLEADGSVSAAAWAALGSVRLGQPMALELEGSSPEPVDAAAEEAAGPPAPGTVVLRAGGALRERLGGEECFDARLPAPLADVLREIADRRPGVERYLLRDGEPFPAVFRSGTRLGARSTVHSGDVLDVVMAIRGG